MVVISPNSGVLVLPRQMNPAALNFAAQICVTGRDKVRVAQKPRPHVKRVASVGRSEIFHKKGDPAERPVGNYSTLRLRASLIEQRGDYRIQLRVERFDAIDCGVDQFERRNPALTDQIGLSNRVEVNLDPSFARLLAPVGWRPFNFTNAFTYILEPLEECIYHLSLTTK